MKTRIIYPDKIWFNKEFHNLSPKTSLLALFLISNDIVGLTPIYECKDLKIMFTLKLTEKELQSCKEELITSNLFDFYKEWVFIKNDFSYCDYFGQEKVMHSKEKEQNSIPADVTDYFKGLKRGYEGVINPSINHKSIIINNNIYKYIKREDITEKDFEEIASRYQVPISFVRSKWDDVCNWEDEKPGRMKGRNWRLTLINWVKRDSLEIKQNYAKQNSDLAL